MIQRKIVLAAMKKPTPRTNAVQEKMQQHSGGLENLRKRNNNITICFPNFLLETFKSITKSTITLYWHNKQYHSKVLLNSFHLPGLTL